MAEVFEKGILVEHASLGLGKIIHVEPEHLHVYFLNATSRFTTKLQLSLVVPKLLRRAAEQAHPELDALPRFVREGNRFALQHDRITHDQAVAMFRARFHAAFEDPVYLDQERDYKIHAHKQFVEKLGNGKGEALLAQGSIRELVDTALRVERLTNLTHPQFEKPRLAEALQDDVAAKRFFEALFSLLSAPQLTEELFERFAAAVDALPTKGGPVARWPTTTIFLALARPERFIFFRPTFTQEAAVRLGYELNYRPEPNWLTYRSLLDFAQLLLGKLRPLGARDLVDVQSFIYVTVAYDK